MGRPIMHFEIATPDVDVATGFYRELFDWSVGAEITDGYRLVQTADGSIGGGLLRTPEGVDPYVTVYVSVDDIRATLERAQQLGGKMVVEPMPIPGVGTFAMVQDPGGAMMGLFEEQEAQDAMMSRP